jgi:prolyl 4-hydroxylase
MMKKVIWLFFLNGSSGFAMPFQTRRNIEKTKLHSGFGPSKQRSKKKKKKKQKSAHLVESFENKSDKKESDDQLDQPKLVDKDKWGLPIQTEEEILKELFPLMPDGTELIPVESSKDYTLVEIQNCLREYIDLNLDHRFHDDGFEKVFDDQKPMKLRLLHQSPPVLAIDNFFTTDECERLKDATKTGHEMSSATFTGALSTRTSTSWFCNYQDVPVLLAKANQILNIPLETMEEPQIVRYKQGQEFSWHYDEVPAAALKNGGQRLATLLVYLSDIKPKNGGGTMFRDLTIDSENSEALVMQPKEGSALLFFPAFFDGKPGK